MDVFKSDGDYIYLDCHHAEFYVPMFYFDSTKNLATDKGEIVDTFGVIDVAIYENSDTKTIKTLNLPSIISLFNYDSETRDVELSNGEIHKCRVIKYLKGAKIMPARIVQSFHQCKLMLLLILSGNIPKLIPYSRLLEIWYKNQAIHNVNFGI